MCWEWIILICSGLCLAWSLFYAEFFFLHQSFKLWLLHFVYLFFTFDYPFEVYIYWSYCHLQAVWTSGEEDAWFCWRNFISFWVCPELIWLVCITVQVIFIIPVEILHPKGISLGISGSGTEKKQWELSISKSMARVPHHISPLFCGHHVAVMCFREIAQ